MAGMGGGSKNLTTRPERLFSPTPVSKLNVPVSLVEELISLSRESAVESKMFLQQRSRQHNWVEDP